MISVSVPLLGAILFYALRRAYRLFTVTWSLRGIPIHVCLIGPLRPLSSLFPSGKWNPGIYYAWNQKDTLYRERNSELILFLPMLYGDIDVYCSSPEVLKDILGNTSLWVKPDRVLGLDIMGPNLIASRGEQWRRHRKITAPAFDNQTYANVWEVTSRLYGEMMNSDEWKSGEQHAFSSFNAFTTRLALLVIVACGFNIHLGWEESPRRDDLGLSNPVDETVVLVSSTLLPRLLLPSWAWKLPINALRRIETAFKDLEKFLRAEVAVKKDELAKDVHFDGTVSSTNKNVFGRVVAASQEEGAKGLDIREITGNLFVFLLAGHETTAHTLVATLALLALHQEEQERVHKHIRSVVGDADPTYDDYNTLAPVLHCFYETVRLYPAAYLMVRAATGDTSLTSPGLIPSGNTVAILKGIEIVTDIIGASRNPRLYPNPGSFIPTRWDNTPSSSSITSDQTSSASSPLDAFLGFSSGPRVCVGKKFATTEAVCFLSLLLRDWKVDVKREGKETDEEWQERVMNPTLGVSMKTGDVPLILTRRTA